MNQNIKIMLSIQHDIRGVLPINSHRNIEKLLWEMFSIKEFICYNFTIPNVLFNLNCFLLGYLKYIYYYILNIVYDDNLVLIYEICIFNYNYFSYKLS